MSIRVIYWCFHDLLFRIHFRFNSGGNLWNICLNIVIFSCRSCLGIGLMCLLFHSKFFDQTIQSAQNFGSSAQTNRILGFDLSNNDQNFINPSSKCNDYIIANNYTTPTGCKTVTIGGRSFSQCYYPQNQAARWCPRTDSLIKSTGMGYESINLENRPADVDCYQPEDPPDTIRKRPVKCCGSVLP